MKKKILKFVIGTFIVVIGFLATNLMNSGNIANAKLVVPCSKAFNQDCTYKDAQGDEHTLTEAREDSHVDSGFAIFTLCN